MRLPRFYPILDAELLGARGLGLVEAAQAIVDAGAGILQLRHKGHFTAAVFEQASAIASLCRNAGVSFIVNDRADIALLLDAGVHLGRDDLSASDARVVVGPSRTLGLSTHNEEQVRAALRQPADYLAFGPIFPTVSKRNPDPVAGICSLQLVRSLAGVPLVAIGGITLDTAAEVLSAGADSVAIIAGLYPDPLNAAALGHRAREWIARTS